MVASEVNKLDNKTILVTGATGKQGGAAARSLLKRGWKVRALVRDTSSLAATELQKLGASLHLGSFDDPSTLLEAMKNVYGVYSVQNFFEVGFDMEVQQSRLIADTAKQSGVQHFVYGSVIGADRQSGIPHFVSKWKIEQHIKEIGLPATILRPVAYMENFLPGHWYTNGTLSLPMKAERKLQMLAVKDIGEFSAIAFEEPANFLDRALELAGDELNMPQAAEVCSRVLGRSVRFVEIPIDTMRKINEEIASMFAWFNEEANFADIDKLRSMNHELWTFEQWLRQADFAEN